jgi:hypothetical protein
MFKKLQYTGLSLVLAFAAYAGVWHLYSKKFEKHIEEKLVEVQSKGFDVSFDHLKITGFPFGYDVSVTNLEIKRGKVFRTWVDGVITFSAKIWKPQEISSVAGGTHHLEFDDFVAQGQGFILRSFTIDPMRFEFFYDHMVVKSAAKEVLKAKELEFDLDFTPKNEADNASLRLRLEELETDQLKDSPLGPKIEHVILDAGLKGKVEGDTNLERAKSWYNNDGVLDVKEFSFQWGETTANGDGTFTLDENLQPLGSFSAAFTGLNEAVDAYEKAGQLDKRKATMLKAGFNLFHSAAGSKISVTLQNRKLSLGAISLVEIPEINW